MRGKLYLNLIRSIWRRITPAHAGKTVHWSARFWQDSDHPRACGENLWGSGCRSGRCGSPPRMRGKHFLPLCLNLPNRITPAHAGKTKIKNIYCISCTDHPRACGENFWRGVGVFFWSGSPPRMRGKRHGLRPSRPRGRITPAHAGKTR